MKQLTETEAKEMFDEMLDEYATEWETPSRSASNNMNEQDPTMYRCGFNDYIDSLQKDGYEVEGY